MRPPWLHSPARPALRPGVGGVREAACAGPAQGPDDLGRYIDRIAMANHRLLEVRDGCVRFTYRNRRQGNQGQTMTLEAQEFIRRFLPHIVPHGFQRLRHVGFLANRCKAHALRQCRLARGQPLDPPPREHPSAVEWMRQAGTGSTSPNVRSAATVHWCEALCPPGQSWPPSQEAAPEGPIWDSS